MSIQDKAQHQISQLDKEVRIHPLSRGLCRKETSARLQHARLHGRMMLEISESLHASHVEEELLLLPTSVISIRAFALWPAA
jgi:hypothetical protein